MCECELPHIPSRLHWRNRPLIEIFEDKEYLYRRITEKQLENPYAEITLADLSHNRSGHRDNILSNKDDVLFNTDKNKAIEKIEIDKDGNKFYICALRIYNPDNEKYIRRIDDYVITLLHDPDPCMYPHSVISIANTVDVVTFDNYDATLGSKAAKKTRQKIRKEIASMIIKESIVFPEVTEKATSGEVAPN